MVCFSASNGMQVHGDGSSAEAAEHCDRAEGGYDPEPGARGEQEEETRETSTERNQYVEGKVAKTDQSSFIPNAQYCVNAQRYNGVRTCVVDQLLQCDTMVYVLVLWTNCCSAMVLSMSKHRKS